MARLSFEKKRVPGPVAHPAAVPVRVYGAGGASVGGAAVVPAPGEEIQQAVLNHLQRLAISLGTPVRATIQDDRAGCVVPLEVSADGSSRVTGKAVRVAQPEAPEFLRTPRGEFGPAPVMGAGAGAPGVETAASAEEAQAPVVEAAVPGAAGGVRGAEASAPVVDAPASVVEAPAPPVHALAPAPAEKASALVGDAPALVAAPGVDAPAPAPTPAENAPASASAAPAPADEASAPLANDAPAPVVNTPAPPAPSPAAPPSDAPASLTPAPAPKAVAPAPEAAVTAGWPVEAVAATTATPTPPRGFDAVAEEVLGEGPVTETVEGAELLTEPVTRINEAVRAGRIEDAAGLVERTVDKATAVLGADHTEVLHLRELAAYIAYLAGEPVRACRLSLDLARLRRTARDADAAYGNVQSASTAWRAVRDPEEGLRLGRDLIDLWADLAAEPGPAAEDPRPLESARARMLRLTDRASRAAGHGAA
ncbi:tetratricopeptide repeat protein [Streptomyces sp. AM6-12]|uniref:tetratricopeptide repeat protein n=1 Tax=Streptomyces sp. AM6-12 TaxID=3345149 RepID=UPI0037AD8531